MSLLQSHEWLKTFSFFFSLFTSFCREISSLLKVQPASQTSWWWILDFSPGKRSSKSCCVHPCTWRWLHAWDSVLCATAPGIPSISHSKTEGLLSTDRFCTFSAADVEGNKEQSGAKSWESSDWSGVVPVAQDLASNKIILFVRF